MGDRYHSRATPADIHQALDSSNRVGYKVLRSWVEESLDSDQSIPLSVLKWYIRASRLRISFNEDVGSIMTDSPSHKDLLGHASKAEALLAKLYPKEG